LLDNGGLKGAIAGMVPGIGVIGARLFAAFEVVAFIIKLASECAFEVLAFPCAVSNGGAICGGGCDNCGGGGNSVGPSSIGACCTPCKG